MEQRDPKPKIEHRPLPKLRVWKCLEVDLPLKQKHVFRVYVNLRFPVLSPDWQPIFGNRSSS